MKDRCFFQCDFIVEDIYSKSGQATAIKVTHKTNPMLKILFDAGVSNGSFEDANYVFVTHSHIDHIGALLSHARFKSLSERNVQYYVPSSAVEDLHKVIIYYW